MLVESGKEENMMTNANTSWPKTKRIYTDAIKNFIRSTGLARINSIVDYAMLEHFLREDLKLNKPNGCN